VQDGSGPDDLRFGDLRKRRTGVFVCLIARRGRTPEQRTGSHSAFWPFRFPLKRETDLNYAAKLPPDSGVVVRPLPAQN